MPSTRNIEADESPGKGTNDQGRGYTLAGVGLSITLAVVVIGGLAGAVGMGVLAVGEAFFVLGAGLAVLSLAVVGLLFSMHRTLNLLKDQQSSIDRLQDQRARATAQEQRRTDRAQDGEIEQLEADPGKRPNTHNGQPGLPTATPFGDIHRVIDVEGIGEGFAPKLGELNIVDTEQLWQADAEAVCAELGIPEKTVRSWQAMSELMALKHVGPQYAELLVRAEVFSIDQLAGMDAGEVVRAVQQAEGDREVRIQGSTIGENHTRRWIEAAHEHEPKAMRLQR